MSRNSRLHRRRAAQEDVELNITPFMNLMIVLVPVLLLSMVFTHIRIHEVQLPELAQRISSESDEQKNLELVVRDSGFELYYPAGVLLKTFPRAHATSTESSQLPFDSLQDYLREVKATFQSKNIEKEDITVLAEPKTSYQTLIATLDAVKFIPEQTSQDEVIIAALFPNVALGEAP